MSIEFSACAKCGYEKDDRFYCVEGCTYCSKLELLCEKCVDLKDFCPSCMDFFCVECLSPRCDECSRCRDCRGQCSKCPSKRHKRWQKTESKKLEKWRKLGFNDKTIGRLLGRTSAAVGSHVGNEKSRKKYTLKKRKRSWLWVPGAICEFLISRADRTASTLEIQNAIRDNPAYVGKLDDEDLSLNGLPYWKNAIIDKLQSCDIFEKQPNLLPTKRDKRRRYKLVVDVDLRKIQRMISQGKSTKRRKKGVNASMNKRRAFERIYS